MRDKVLIESKRSGILKLTGDFCDRYINAEYRELCEKLVNKMSRKRDVPFLRGKIEIWAAGIIYALGQINFLFGSSSETQVRRNDICAHFGSSQSVISQKAKKIRDMFKITYFDDDFSTARSKDENPLKDFWMLENGLIVNTDTLMKLMEKAADIRAKFSPFQSPVGGEGRKRKRRRKCGEPEDADKAASAPEERQKQKSLLDF